MFKRIAAVIVCSMFLISAYGCVALLAGAAGGAGTSVWLSGKLTQEVNAPFEHSIRAARSGLKSLKLAITKETVEKDVAQIMSKYTDGKTIWIDVKRITNTSSKIEVRVGGVSSDKAAADTILKRIRRYLY